MARELNNPAEKHLVDALIEARFAPLPNIHRIGLGFNEIKR